MAAAAISKPFLLLVQGSKLLDVVEKNEDRVFRGSNAPAWLTQSVEGEEGMFRVEWDEKLATGVAEIDEQHREIFVRFNALLDACDRGRSRELLADILEFMSQYVLQHFQDEERLQASVDYPERIFHKSVHAELSGRFVLLQSKFVAHGATVQLVIETCKLLSEVLFEHIQQHDKALADFLLQRSTPLIAV